VGVLRVSFFRARLSTLDRLATHLATGLVAILLLPLVYAAAIGSGTFTLRHRSALPLLDTNKVPLVESYQMVAWGGAAWVLLALLHGAVLLGKRVRTGQSGGLATVRVVNTLLAPTLAVPIFARLLFPAIEGDNPKETFFLIAVAATSFGVGAHGLLKLLAPDAAGPGSAASTPRGGARHTAPALVLVLLWAGYAFRFSTLAITNHHALSTSIRDLGYYDNSVYQTIHGRLLGCSFIDSGYHVAAHFDPILILISPLYLIYPRAELLLVLQSIWLGSGVVPVYAIAANKLQNRFAAVTLAAMYLLHPALHGMNLYEMHSLSLVTPLALWLLYFFETRAFVWYWGMLVLVLLCREDVPLLTLLVGLYAIRLHALDGAKGSTERLVRVGWKTMVVSAVYFVVAKAGFQTSWGGKIGGARPFSYAYYYEDLIPNKNDVPGLLISLFTNPVFALRTCLAEPKVLFVITVFLPLAFLPFFAKRARILLVYGMLFCLLASRSAVFSVHFQYPATLLPFAFAITPIALAQLADRAATTRGSQGGRLLAFSILAAAFAATVLVSWKYGAIVENETFRGGFRSVVRELSTEQQETYRFVRSQADKIPISASVAATERMGPHISNRRNAFLVPDQLDEAPVFSVDYFFVDEGELSSHDLKRLQGKLHAGQFVEVGRLKKLAVYKRPST
jgi:uncharacterized membrane protein